MIVYMYVCMHEVVIVVNGTPEILSYVLVYACRRN